MNSYSKPARPKLNDLGITRWREDPKLYRTGFQRNLERKGLRALYRPHFRELSHRKDYPKLVEALRQFVTECIPAPVRTEAEWWSVTCLPSTNGNRLSAVNIHWMEAFVLGVTVDGPPTVWGLINVYKDRLIRTYGSNEAIVRAHPEIEMTHAPYQSAYKARVPAMSIVCDGIDNVLGLLHDPAIIGAARGLNWPVMSLGRTVYAKYHCYDLADQLLKDLLTKTQA